MGPSAATAPQGPRLRLIPCAFSGPGGRRGVAAKLLGSVPRPNLSRCDTTLPSSPAEGEQGRS